MNREGNQRSMRVRIESLDQLRVIANRDEQLISVSRFNEAMKFYGAASAFTIDVTGTGGIGFCGRE